MKYLRAFGLAFGILVMPVPSVNDAQAQSAEARQLAACFIRNSLASDQRAMRDFLIAALENRSAGELKRKVEQFGIAALDLGVKRCGISVSDARKPFFRQGMQAYSQHVVTKLFETSVAKLR